MSRLVGVVLAAVMGVAGSAVGGIYGGGSGTPEDPYQIGSAEDMQAIGADPDDWDKSFILMADIDLGEYTGAEFNMIGRFYSYSDPRNEPFVGVFDGNNNKILNFTYETSDTNGIGLFAYVSCIYDGNWPPETIGQIRNLGLANVDVNVPNGNLVSSLVGFNWGLIENCYATGSVSAAGGEDVGGLVGGHEGVGLHDAYFKGQVTGANYVGGLVGFGEVEITGCFSAGNVEGINRVGGLVGDFDEEDLHRSFSSCSVQGVSRVGGLIGFIGDEGSIWDCYATGDVTGTEYVGGLAGFTDKYGDDDEYAEISRSYATGRVTGRIDTSGGLVGYNRGRVTDSYWDVETSGIEEPGPGTGFPTSQLQQQSTFTDWDFITTWEIVEGKTYPFLVWQKYSGGTGTPEDPYQIRSSEDIIEMSGQPDEWDDCFVMVADVNMVGHTFATAVIAPDTDNADYSFNGVPFEGVFEGDGHVICNLTIDTGGAGNDYLGLFGKIGGSGAEVRNLGMEDINITGGVGSYYLGGLCGYNGGDITTCYATGSVSATGGNYVGGLVGEHEGGAVRDSYFRGDVAGGTYKVGGLMGYSEGEVTGCFSAGSVEGINYVGGLIGEYDEDDLRSSFSSCNVQGVRGVGGLVGMVVDEGDILDCYATGDATGTEYTGGLAGIVDGEDEDEMGHIIRSFASGLVVGSEGTTGGLVGHNLGRITDSYWDSEMSGLSNMCGVGNGECQDSNGKTTEQMEQQSTFTDWDFINVWNIGENQTYPYLRTVPASDINKDRITNFLDLCIVAEQWCEEQ